MTYSDDRARSMEFFVATPVSDPPAPLPPGHRDFHALPRLEAGRLDADRTGCVRKQLACNILGPGMDGATGDRARPFVGRTAELADLRAALLEAVAGRGRLYLIAGEPGIGKTRACQEVAALAPELGMRALLGSCN